MINYSNVSVEIKAYESPKVEIHYIELEQVIASSGKDLPGSGDNDSPSTPKYRTSYPGYDLQK